VLANVKGYWVVSDLCEFVRTFSLEKEFHKLTGMSIEKWDDRESYKDTTDEEMMEALLNDVPGTYIIIYNEAHDWFEIFELDCQ